MSEQNIQLNDNLHKVDNVLNALNYLLEEIETRKNQMTDLESVRSIVKEQMDDYYFMNSIYRHFNDNHGDGLCREVAFKVMTQIDNDIEAFIENRVNKALEQAGVVVTNN